MKYLKILIIAAAALSLVGCEGEDDFGKGGKGSKNKFVEKTISPETAKENLQSLLSALDISVDPSTIALKKIGWAEIKSVIDDIVEVDLDTFYGDLKFEDILGWKRFPNVLVYAATFRDSGGTREGMALLAGNTALNAPVLYLSEMSDVEDSSPAKVRASDGSAKFIDVDIDGEMMAYVLGMAIIGDYNDAIHMPSGEPDRSLCDEAHVGTRWGVESPFSDLLDGEDGGHDASSIVIALMQIMAQQGTPLAASIYPSAGTWEELSVIGTPEWDDMTEEQQAALGAGAAGIASVLSRACGISYDNEDEFPSGSSEAALRTLKNYGYSPVLLQGGGNDVLKEIDLRLLSGKPVYMDGDFCGVGQAWVVDGLCGDMYHINMGCYGEFDGYVARTAFASASAFEIAPFALFYIDEKLREEMNLPADGEFKAYFRSIVY